MRLRSRLCATLAAFLFLAVTIAPLAPLKWQTAGISPRHEIFRVLHRADPEIQVAGTVTFGSGGTYHNDGVTPRWQ